jgi:hypothetical protein
MGPGTHTSQTLLDKANFSRESLHCNTTLGDTAYNLRARKAALPSEHVNIALFTMPSEMLYSEHTKIVYTQKN